MLTVLGREREGLYSGLSGGAWVLYTLSLIMLGGDGLLNELPDGFAEARSPVP